MTTLSPNALASDFCPGGSLRAAINLGNPILANRDAATGRVFGVSVDLATALADRLGRTLDLVVVDGAAKSVAAIDTGAADIGFFAIDPVRGAGIQFTPPYVNIEGAYLVRQDSKLKTNEEVDQVGHRIAVGNGSAYDLYLTREIKNAQLVKAATSQAVVETFLGQNLEVAAGVRQQMESDAKRLGGLRLLPGRFMVIHQAMGMSKGRGQTAHDYLFAFVEEMKASGFVAEALKRHGIEGAAVAPAGKPA